MGLLVARGFGPRRRSNDDNDARHGTTPTESAPRTAITLPRSLQAGCLPISKMNFSSLSRALSLDAPFLSSPVLFSS